MIVREGQHGSKVAITELDMMYFVKSLLYRHPSWRSEETQERERSRTGSESSQTGTSATSGRNARRRESEKSLENETPNKEEDCQSPTSKPPKLDQPLKVMPAPPPKENAWVKRSSNPPARSQSSDTEQQTLQVVEGKQFQLNHLRKDQQGKMEIK